MLQFYKPCSVIFYIMIFYVLLEIKKSLKKLDLKVKHLCQQNKIMEPQNAATLQTLFSDFFI